MYFIIQAGGKGSRLKKITKGQSKSLVKINGKSIIDYQIKNILKYSPKKKIILITNKKYFSLKSHILKKYKKSIQIICESVPKGTGGSLYPIKKYNSTGYF